MNDLFLNQQKPYRNIRLISMAMNKHRDTALLALLTTLLTTQL
jgi:hypothetical protein